MHSCRIEKLAYPFVFGGAYNQIICYSNKLIIPVFCVSFYCNILKVLLNGYNYPLKKTVFITSVLSLSWLLYI